MSETPKNFPYRIFFPTSSSHPEYIEDNEKLGYDFKDKIVIGAPNRCLVVVGANGSGKTRLGTWLESMNPDATHRISAQKSLNLQPSYSSSSIDQALSNLFYGTPNGGAKLNKRWQNKPNTILLNDFDFLMTYLFSDDYEQSQKYKQFARETTNRLEPPETKLDVIKQTWEEVLPNRKLKISAGKIETQHVGNSAAIYNASEMSDGERVVLYMIGQALSVPSFPLRASVIIVDEPELHVHKSIQATLWDKIEARRPDCLFVYLTHDLDFATSRVGAVKVCLTNYHKTIDNATTDMGSKELEHWDWFLVPENRDIPEEIYLKILGSRKPILFVEGELASFDKLIYERLYPEFMIVPSGGCNQVIQQTSSFRSCSAFHRLNCFGLIDRDDRTSKEVRELQTYFQNNGGTIFVLEFREIENLFLAKEVLKILANDLRITDFDQVFNNIQEKLFADLIKNKGKIISSMTIRKIEASLKQFDNDSINEAHRASSLNKLLETKINAAALYAESEKIINDVINAKNYGEAIKINDNKKFLLSVAHFLGKTGSSMENYIKAFISSEDGIQIMAAMKKYTPIIPTK